MEHRILVIDDEQDIREAIQEIAADIAPTLMAGSAQEAFDILKKENITLVISDIMMPEISGIQLLKRLRAQRFKFPVVFVSASDDEEILAQALEYGAADFIAKPFNLDEISALIKRQLATVDLTAA